MSSTGYCEVYGSSNWETNNADSYKDLSDNNASGARTTSKIRFVAMRMRFDTGGAPTLKDQLFVGCKIWRSTVTLYIIK